MTLRPYQVEAVQAIHDQWSEGLCRILLNLPTGCGKTVVFSAIAKDQVMQGERVLILAHRDELLKQAADKLKTFAGLNSALEKADSHAADSKLSVVVGSVQTLLSEKRKLEYPRDYFGTIIVDEAHHAAAESYISILDYFDSAKALGVTATPFRGDKKKLATVFQSIAYEYTLPRAIQEGYLSPIKAQMIPIELDLSKVRVSAGDYSEKDLGNALEPYLESIADEMVNYCKGRKTVVFLPLIATSQHFAEILTERGFKAAEVNGQSDNRAEILADFESGKLDVLCNAMLLTEGWDCPPVDCIVPLRPTRSRGLYMQMIGRGTRRAPGKKDLLILDFLWLTGQHSLCKPASLVASTERIEQKMNDKALEAIDEIDLLDMQQVAMAEIAQEESAKQEREQALADRIAAQKGKKKRLVNPIDFALSINMVDLIDYEPQFHWESERPTEKQLKVIENLGLDPSTVTNKGMASLIIDRVFERSKAGYATPKQIQLLERRGYANVSSWLNSEAAFMIDRIKENQWRLPKDRALWPGGSRSTPRRLRA